MATATLSDIINSLPVQFHERLSRTWNRSATFLSQIPIVAGRGGACAFNVNVGGSTASSAPEGQVINVSSQSTFDTIVPASLPWAQYNTVFSLTDLEMLAANSSLGGTTAVMDIFEERLFDSITSLISRINSDLFSGTGNDGNQTIVGFLGGALPVAGQTYANLAVNTYPSWSSNVLANGGVARGLSVDLLNAGDKAQFVAANTSANLIMADASSYQKYAGLFESLRRVNGDTSKQRYGTGASALEFMNAKFDRDKDMPAGNVLMLDTTQFELRYLPWTEDTNQSAVKAQIMVGMGSNGDNSTPVGLPVRVWALPKVGGLTSFAVDIYCQLVVRRPNAQVLISDIATS